MAKIKRRKRKVIPWNKGRKVGPRAPLSNSHVARVKKMLAKRGDSGLRDRALFLTAIDTMLRAPDLLGLTVKQVRKRNRDMRSTLDLATARGGLGRTPHSFSRSRSGYFTKLATPWITRTSPGSRRIRERLSTISRSDGGTGPQPGRLSRHSSPSLTPIRASRPGGTRRRWPR